MRMLIVAALIGIGIPALAAPVPKDAKKAGLENRIIGKWKLVNGNANANAANYSFTITYKKGGEMSFTREYFGINAGIEPQISPGKYKVGEPDETYKLGSIDWSVTEFNRQRGEVSKILKLNDNELEFEDPQGLIEKFERVKEEKKDK